MNKHIRVIPYPFYISVFIAVCIISFYANVAYVLVHACSRIADYHLNVFTLSWPQGVPVTWILGRRSEDLCGGVPLLGLSLSSERGSFLLVPYTNAVSVLFLIRSASLRWLMKTVEYDSYAALTASYFASLPRERPSPLVSTTRAFIRRYRILGVIISWIWQTGNIVRPANVWWKLRIEKYVNAVFSLFFFYRHSIYIYFFNRSADSLQIF